MLVFSPEFEGIGTLGMVRREQREELGKTYYIQSLVLSIDVLLIIDRTCDRYDASRGVILFSLSLL